MLFLQKNVFTCIFLVVLSNFVLAQNIDLESLLVQESEQKAVELYAESLGKYYNLLSGSEYIEHDRFITGHAFYGENEWSKGEILYDGILYKNVVLKYDIYKDVVIANLSFERHSSTKVALHYHKIGAFTLQDKLFVMISDLNPSKPQFYEVIYNGTVKAIVRREKNLNERVESLEIKREFLSRDIFYIWKDDRYHSVKSKSSLLKLFTDHKKEINDLLKEQEIIFKKHRELAIVLAVHYFDQQN
jgi:hypothetical protein